SGIRRPDRAPSGDGSPVIAALVLAAVAWQAPLPPPLVVERPFVPPAVAWAPGHRGVDLAADPGAVVRSAGPGRVVYAGPLARRFVISIEHATPIAGLGSGWRTTYEGVRPAVAVGDIVSAGEVIGSLDTRGTHCRCLHWGLKRGSSYADPLLLLRRPIVLKPYARG
ncbi:MAG: murein hydrolase activator EnvC family protein, partial [Actinomycetota bacterium]